VCVYARAHVASHCCCILRVIESAEREREREREREIGSARVYPVHGISEHTGDLTEQANLASDTF